MLSKEQGLFIAGVILSVLLTICLARCLDLRRQRRRRRWPPQPPDIPSPIAIQNALNRLYTVTEKRTQLHYRAEGHDTECPICLSSFSRKSEESPRPTDCDVNTSKAGLIKCEINNAPQSVEEEEEKEEEILVIRQCGHTFYAQCLVAWFMKGKYQCPVCRGRYYVPTKTERLAQLREMITA